MTPVFTRRTINKTLSEAGVTPSAGGLTVHVTRLTPSLVKMMLGTESVSCGGALKLNWWTDCPQGRRRHVQTAVVISLLTTSTCWRFITHSNVTCHGPHLYRGGVAQPGHLQYFSRDPCFASSVFRLFLFNVINLWRMWPLDSCASYSALMALLRGRRHNTGRIQSSYVAYSVCRPTYM